MGRCRGCEKQERIYSASPNYNGAISYVYRSGRFFDGEDWHFDWSLAGHQGKCVAITHNGVDQSDPENKYYFGHKWRIVNALYGDGHVRTLSNADGSFIRGTGTNEAYWAAADAGDD